MSGREVVCPVTNEFCPHLSLLEEQKDGNPVVGMIIITNPHLEIEQTVEIPIEQRPYDSQVFVRRMALKNPGTCRSRPNTTTCGVVTRLGLENDYS